MFTAISTHAPRAGSDPLSLQSTLISSPFQPTLPVRGATPNRRKAPSTHVFQPTLPVRGATRGHEPVELFFFISTHAPRAGSDRAERHIHHGYGAISTHAPRAGSDAWRGWRRSRPAYFNPRSPCGERHATVWDLTGVVVFQPTLPVRGATRRFLTLASHPKISTHAPRAGSDLTIRLCAMRKADFNPRSPCGERLHGWVLALMI